jgi:hypothetical protein
MDRSREYDMPLSPDEDRLSREEERFAEPLTDSCDSEGHIFQLVMLDHVYI